MTVASGPPGVRSADRRALVLGCAAGLLGVVLVVAGTFLPWVRSGSVDRNLYTIAGIANRIGLFGDGSAIPGWLTLIGPACVLPVLAGLLRLFRTAAVLAIVLGALCGTAAGAALLITAGRSAVDISLASTGPVTVLTGSLLLLAGGLAVLIGRLRPVGTQPSGPAVPRQLEQSDTATVIDGRNWRVPGDGPRSGRGHPAPWTETPEQEQR